MAIERPAIARVRGLGSGHEGTGHFKAQRLTSVALVPLVIWFVFSIATFQDASHAEVAAWLGSPLPAALTITLMVMLFWHAQLGVQVVIEDYVNQPALRLIGLIGNILGMFVLGAACVVAVLKVAIGN